MLIYLLFKCLAILFKVIYRTEIRFVPTPGISLLCKDKLFCIMQSLRPSQNVWVPIHGIPSFFIYMHSVGIDAEASHASGLMVYDTVYKKGI